MQKQHAEALVALLQHEGSSVRNAAAYTFGQLASSALAQHVEALVALLQHADWSVRRVAASAFGQLEE